MDNILVDTRLIINDGAELGSTRARHHQRRATLGHGRIRRGGLELEGERLADIVVLLAVDDLIHSKRRGGRFDLVGVVELGSAHIDLRASDIRPVRDVRREHTGVGRHAHRDGRDDIGGVRPSLARGRGLVDAVGVDPAGVLVGELCHGEGGGAVLGRGDVGERGRVGGVVALGGGGELERLPRLGGLAVDGLAHRELELARHHEGVVLLVGNVEGGRRAGFSNAERLGLVELLLVLLLAVGAFEHEIRSVGRALITRRRLGLHKVVQRAGKQWLVRGAELHHAVCVARLGVHKRFGAVPGNLVQLKRCPFEDFLGIGGIELRNGDAIARALGGDSSLHDHPHLLMRGRAVGNTGKLGAVRQVHLVAGVSGRLHLIHHINRTGVGNGDGEPCRTGAAGKRNVLSEGEAIGNLSGRALVIHVECGRQVRALGVHGIHEREGIGTWHEVDRALVHRDGVLDVRAVGHLFGRLLHNLVRALDGLETGGESLRTSLSVCLVGELHRRTGVAQG